MKSMQKGFTLIELMIVVAIIAILAAIAIPAYQNYLIRSQVTEGMSLSGGLKTGETEFFSNYGRWPTTNSSAGVATPSSIIGSYVTSVGSSGGIITIHYGKKANKAIADKTLKLSPFSATGGGSFAWTCKTTGTDGVDQKYLPSSCRN